MPTLLIAIAPQQFVDLLNRVNLKLAFTQNEAVDLLTTSNVDNSERILRFPIPHANVCLNLLNLRGILGTNPSVQPSFFEHPWYLTEPFATDNCEPGWHGIHMDVLPDSVGQSIHYADRLSDRGLGLPKAIDVVLMLILHHVATKEQLLKTKHTWCADHDSQGRFVTVGAFGRNGIFVSAHSASYTSRGLGICGKLLA